MTDAPVITRHAADRYDERTPDDSVCPEVAWQHGQTIDAGGPFLNVDVRYHRETGTLLLRRASVVETVYDVEDLTPQAEAAVKHALPEVTA